METYIVLYNPLSGNGRGGDAARGIERFLPAGSIVYRDATKLSGFDEAIRALAPGEKPVICGGDGTLNRFINDVDGMELPDEVLYYGTGSGNDFLNDLGRKPEDGPVRINEYIRALPRVEVNGMSRLFLNGVGFGIDGYCCEEGDRIRASSDKPVNYTNIAIKGLLYAFKPVNAKVTVDGKTMTYEKVWLAPAMNGRCYGGGMFATPGQDRLDPERRVSVLVFRGTGKLRTLMIFPSIFKGEHVKHVKHCTVLKGNSVTVEFDRPTALQIDGETVTNVTKYSVKTMRN